MKLFFTAILAVSLLNPFCQCGELAIGKSTAVAWEAAGETCSHSEHGPHRDHHESPCEFDCFPDERGLVNSSIAVPAAPAPASALWTFLLPDLEARSDLCFLSEPDNAPPDDVGRLLPTHTGVFRL